MSIDPTSEILLHPGMYYGVNLCHILRIAEYELGKYLLLHHPAAALTEECGSNKARELQSYDRISCRDELGASIGIINRNAAQLHLGRYITLAAPYSACHSYYEHLNTVWSP